MLDLILEFIHHVAVFSLVGVLAAEFVLIQPGLAGERLSRVLVLDALYGGLAFLIVVVGVSRVIWGDAGWEFYVYNWTFWVKMGLFLAVGLISIGPTLAIQRWRKARGAEPGFAVAGEAVAGLRRYFVAQFALIAFIPIFAALMARGIGL